MQKELNKRILLDTKLEIDSLKKTKSGKIKERFRKNEENRVRSLERYYDYLEKKVY